MEGPVDNGEAPVDIRGRRGDLRSITSACPDLSWRLGRIPGTVKPRMSLPLPFLTEVAHGYSPRVGRAEGIYLDYNGSAPLAPRVAQVMANALTEGLGNASSVAAGALCHRDATRFADGLPFDVTELGAEPRVPERNAGG